jgi:hypothetical protein
LLIAMTSPATMRAIAQFSFIPGACCRKFGSTDRGKRAESRTIPSGPHLGVSAQTLPRNFIYYEEICVRHRRVGKGAASLR